MVLKDVASVCRPPGRGFDSLYFRMENPNTWNRAVVITADVIDGHREEICGVSLPMKIVQALTNAGLLKEEADEVQKS